MCGRWFPRGARGEGQEGRYDERVGSGVFTYTSAGGNCLQKIDEEPDAAIRPSRWSPSASVSFFASCLNPSSSCSPLPLPPGTRVASCPVFRCNQRSSSSIPSVFPPWPTSTPRHTPAGSSNSSSRLTTPETPSTIRPQTWSIPPSWARTPPAPLARMRNTTSSPRPKSQTLPVTASLKLPFSQNSTRKLQKNSSCHSSSPSRRPGFLSGLKITT